MSFKAIFPNVYQLALGPVNVFLIDHSDGPTLIDTGNANDEQKIVAALASLGKQARDIRHIVLTHCHPDHAGSVAALKAITGAQVWIHAADAEVVRGQKAQESHKVSPGLLNAILFRLFIKGSSGAIASCPIEHEIGDGDVLPVAGGIRAIHTPGHSSGHMAYLLPNLLPNYGGLLVAGDVCSNAFALDYSIVYTDLEQGKRSLAKLADMEFATICFGHGGVLKGEGVAKFKRKWGVK